MSTMQTVQEVFSDIYNVHMEYLDLLDNCKNTMDVSILVGRYANTFNSTGIFYDLMDLIEEQPPGPAKENLWATFTEMNGIVHEATQTRVSEFSSKVTTPVTVPKHLN